MRERKNRGIGIRWKLFAYLALFTAFVLLVVWVFQVVLLARFYEKIKLDELDKAAAELSKCVSDTTLLKETAEDVLSDSMIFSKVYKVNGEYAYLILSQKFVGNYYLNSVTSTELETLFKAAAENSGKYYLRKTVDTDVGSSPNPDDAAERHKEIIYVQLTRDADDMYIIMLNMIYTPLNTTVNTLHMQFGWIAMVLLFGAIVLSGIISYVISNPLVKMNEAAKCLAKGKYDAEFKGDGYREARELADTLNYASEELSRADDLKKELIANVSHDLRTPLTMITGYSEVMRDIPGENTSENLQVIIDESTRLTELVNDMLDISKIQSGSTELAIEGFDLTETVRSVIQRYGKLMSRDGLRIEFCSNEEVYVEADRARMLQVIYNFINNAINYSGDDKLVRVEQKVMGEIVRISVIDNGEGISPENIEQIWDRYYKVDRVHKRAVAGTGLGLSIVKGILEAHGAKYGVESKLGEGSTFWFELPIVSSPKSTQ